MYHNNTSECVIWTFASMRKVCYGNRSRCGIKTADILATIYVTCRVRGINPYTFMTYNFHSAKIDTISTPHT